MAFLGGNSPDVEFLVLTLAPDVRLVHLDGPLKDLWVVGCHTFPKIPQHALYLILSKIRLFCDT